MVKEFCDDKGSQESNLSAQQKVGLSSIRKRIKEGEIVVLPTDKTGRFAVVTRSTYENVGEVHTAGDEEVGLGELRSNQRVLNGHVSMLLKIFQVGQDTGHVQRWRESMLSAGQEACPLWLLFKCHKGWCADKRGVLPTRLVMRGNAGINTHHKLGPGATSRQHDARLV